MEETNILTKVNPDITIEAQLRLKEDSIQIYIKYVNELDELIKSDRTLKNSKPFIEKRCDLTRSLKILLGGYGLL